MSSASFTLRICPLYDSTSSKDFMLSMAKTHRNPSPVLMYWSLMAEYSSCPAVSRMSNRHVSPSITTCLRYESSIVGSYSSTKWFWMSWMVRADFPTPPAANRRKKEKGKEKKTKKKKTGKLFDFKISILFSLLLLLFSCQYELSKRTVPWHVAYIQ